MRNKKICIITGTRAEWGLFYPLVKEIVRNKLELRIIATGAHLSARFGNTYKEINNDGFSLDRRVDILISGDSNQAIAKSIGLGVEKITRALNSLKPDLVFLLGDRFETFAAAVACLLTRIPIAHIHGGEITEGSIDDSFRHAITKMAYFHFTSTEEYRRRVVQMGENPKRVFNIGALGLDNIREAKTAMNREKLEKELKFKLGKKNIMVTFNPSTAEDKSVSDRNLKNLLKCLSKLSDVKIIFTKGSPDIYSGSIAKLIDEYVLANSGRAVAFTSLGRKLYLSSLKFMDAVVGNSSSGIIEAPSFGIPTINIGNRQRGRIKADSVIDVQGNVKSMREAFKKAFSSRFRTICQKKKNPYGGGKASKAIIDIVKKIKIDGANKRFFDLNKFC